MDGEIVLDRGGVSVMKLNHSEQAMMDEIQLDFTKPRASRPPAVQRMQGHREREPPQMEFQEDVDAFANPVKQNAPAPPRMEDPVDHGEYMDETPYDEDPGTGYGEMESPEDVPSPGYKTIDEEKSDLVNKLGRLEKRGFNVNKRLTAYSPVDELRTEVKRITYSIEVDKSVKFSRRMLVACVTGLEFLNKRYNPFDVQLEGWSENVMETQDDYDEVFEELFVKYRTKMNIAPEVKLIMMLGGSAMMFHLTNSMFKQVMPNMNDVMKQNPDLMNNMMSAVQNTMSNTNTASTPASNGGQYEMKGPGLDISSLMGGIMMPPIPPMNTTPVQKTVDYTPDVPDDDDDISDIVSENGAAGECEDDIKQVKVAAGKPKRGRKKKVEINL
tara:strand:+ start:2037 stop:3191 length:1155 start_codon:yes stop_codon:yes gene_type:complete